MEFEGWPKNGEWYFVYKTGEERLSALNVEEACRLFYIGSPLTSCHFNNLIIIIIIKECSKIFFYF